MDVDKSMQRCSCVVGRTVWENHGLYSCIWYDASGNRDPVEEKKGRGGMCLFLDIVTMVLVTRQATRWATAFETVSLTTVV